jgi:hypothetical protein
MVGETSAPRVILKPRSGVESRAFFLKGGRDCWPVADALAIASRIAMLKFIAVPRSPARRCAEPDLHSLITMEIYSNAGQNG